MIIDVIKLNLDSLSFTRNYTQSRADQAAELYKSDSIKIQEVDQINDTDYFVTSKVTAFYSVYDVFLKIQKDKITSFTCTCEDYKNGYLCKHVIATSIEVLNPHRPTTPEEIEKDKIKKKQEEKEKMAKLIEEQKKERKQKEYKAKYETALLAIENFKSEKHFDDLDYYDLDDNFNSNKEQTLNVEQLYKSCLIKSKNEKSIILSNNIAFEPYIDIEANHQAYISYKIGESSMYVFKNLDEFYDAYVNSEVLEYGKRLHLKVREDSFVLASREMLKFILNYAKIAKYACLLSEEYMLNSSNEKKFVLFEDMMDNYFASVGNNKLTVYSKSLSEINFYNTKDKLNISMKLSKVDAKNYALELSINDYDYVVSKEYIYIFNNRKVYKLDRTDELKDLLDVFNCKSYILIPEERFAEFSTIVLSKISNFLITNSNSSKTEDGKESENDDSVIKLNKLSSKIFLDLDSKGNVILDLKFCYLDYEFNILDKDYIAYVTENKITRNIMQEREVLKRIFLDGFRIDKDKKHFILDNEELIFDFLAVKINQYNKRYELMVTDRFKSKKIRLPKLSGMNVKLDVGLLQVDISKLDVDIAELKNILKNYNIKKKYYKLKNGDFISLEQNESLDLLNDISNTFEVNYEKIENGLIDIPVNRSIYLEKILNKNKEINVERNDSYTTLINNIDNKNFSENIKVAPKFDAILRDYQKIGYKWLKVLEQYNFGGILADDMGLGKTIQVIALFNDQINKKKKQTSIVISPSSLILNWKAEIEKWCDEIKVLVIKGDADTRKEMISTYSKYDVLITSYDSLKRDIDEYQGKNFNYIIADEAQYIKNSGTQNATSLKKLEGNTRFALTGTPIENSVSELWSIFDFIMPNYLYSYHKFKTKFEEPILKEDDEEAVAKLKLMINPFILRRVKKDVLSELPDKNITILKNEMTDEQSKIYKTYLLQTKQEITDELEETENFEKSKFKILMLLTRLRQICCHPSLFIENYKGGSGKLQQCIEIILDAIKSGHKILLFSSYTSMFDLIESELNKSDVKFFKLTGNTKVDERIQLVDRFNNEEDVKVFLISLKAGGTGLNLTGADVVIHFDPWWNLSSENQATDRAYRIGQKNSVQVYKLITENSIEEKINKLQETKSEISEKLLSTNEKFINKLSKEEILQLFDLDD